MQKVSNGQVISSKNDSEVNLIVVAVVTEDSSVLAAKLEHNRSQVLHSIAHDHLANLGRTNECNLVNACRAKGKQVSE